MSEMYFYSAEKNGFYAGSMQADYKRAGKWPTDAVEISERWYSYLLEGQTEGKVVAPDEYNQPVLVNPPEPTQAELISQAEEKERSLWSQPAQLLPRWRMPTNLALPPMMKKKRLPAGSVTG